MSNADYIRKTGDPFFAGFPTTDNTLPSSKDREISLLDASRDMRRTLLAERKVKKPWATKAKARWVEMREELQSSDSNSVQKVLDTFGNRIEHTIHRSPAGKLKTEWLDKTAGGQWYAQLGDFILKLPLRVVMNLLKLTYSIIKGVLYSFVHPIKGIKKLSLHVLDVVYRLKQPLTWTKIGAGIIGASIGSSLVTGNPVAVIGLGIGGALLLGGMISGIIKETITNEKGSRKEAIKKELMEHLKGTPMACLTGFIVGIAAGSIMQAAANMPEMGAAGTETAKITASVTASPPPPTLGLPPFLATHMHHKHPETEKTEMPKEENKPDEDV